MRKKYDYKRKFVLRNDQVHLYVDVRSGPSGVPSNNLKLAFFHRSSSASEVLRFFGVLPPEGFFF